MNVAAASATANVTADEVIVEDALGGSQYRIAGFSKTINLASSGAGGMDTGIVPANGFVAIYAIYNPSTGASALLAVNATSSAVPEVYSGVNLPAGYTASALLSVWGVSSSQFVIGYQTDRKICIVRTNTLNTTANTSGYQAFSIAAVVPKNAKTLSGTLNVSQNSAANGVGAIISPSPSGIGTLGATAVATQGTTSSYIAGDMPVITAQTLYYQTVSSASGTYAFSVSGYTF
ncbi:hypothetical protein CBW22_07445 [Pantoea sp. VS1]|nr:hypothetical protein CBW22_07445 [Pantoea sp. VS1]